MKGKTENRADTTETNNTAVGDEALPVNTTGSFNTAIGNFSLLENTTGTSNTAVGESALDRTDGQGDPALGYNRPKLIG